MSEEDFFDETLLILVIFIEMMLEVLIGVAAEVTNMEVDKVVNMMAEFATNTSLTWRPNF